MGRVVSARAPTAVSGFTTHYNPSVDDSWSIITHIDANHFCRKRTIPFRYIWGKVHYSHTKNRVIGFTLPSLL
ncbi:hypothetical protein GCM10007086_00100 [Photobacterium aphoticum]|nr:hypothetical protein GCM10007086_00100 [Photobacterium aphoticum]